MQVPDHKQIQMYTYLYIWYQTLSKTISDLEDSTRAQPHLESRQLVRTLREDEDGQLGFVRHVVVKPEIRQERKVLHGKYHTHSHNCVICLGGPSNVTITHQSTIASSKSKKNDLYTFKREIVKSSQICCRCYLLATRWRSLTSDLSNQM